MWFARHRQGFSLFEALIGLGLGALLLAVVLPLFHSAGRSSRRAALETEAQQTAALVLDKVVRKLRNSTPPATLWEDGLLAIRELHGLSPEGEQLWEGRATVFHWQESSQELFTWESTIEPAPTTEPGYPGGAASTRLRQSGRRRLAQGVSDFRVTLGTRVELQLLLNRPLPGTPRDHTLALTREVFLPLKAR